MTFLEEICDQPRRLRDLLGELSTGRHPLRSAACARLVRRRPLLLTGMGSSLHACYPAYLWLANRGADAALWETAELIHFAPGAIGPEAVLIVVSQSGETAEVVALLGRLSSSQPLVAVTNVPESTLGRRASVVLPLAAEPSEHPATQTYLNSLVLLAAAARLSLGEEPDPLVAAARRAADGLEEFLARSFESSGAALDGSSHLVFLARGPSLATARQSALLAHEVAGRGAAALSAAAFRHGPLEAAGPGWHAVLFDAYGPTAPLMEGLAADLERLGARLTRIADERLGRGEFRHPPVEEELAPLVHLAPVQAMAYRAALAAGREPGVFRHARSVTRRE